MNAYGSLCDDFGATLYLSSKLELPSKRETVLHYFDAVKKRYPTLTDFERRDNNEYCLEEDRDRGYYRWFSVDGRRLCSGFVNPPSLEEVDEQHLLVLEMAPYHFDIHAIDTEALDVMYYFDLEYKGNHDEIVAEAFGLGGPFDGLLKRTGAKALNFQPSVMVALDEGCQLQARMSIETRTTAYHVRTGQFPESPITVYVTIRQFWGRQPYTSYAESYGKQRQLLDEITSEHVIPHVVQPLQRVIAAR